VYVSAIVRTGRAKISQVFPFLAVFVTASFTNPNKKKAYEQHSASAVLDSLTEAI
jgi:hypothetical protein